MQKFIILLIVFLMLGTVIFVPAMQKEPVAMDLNSNIRAPEFPADLQWLNVAQPLSLRQLRGKIVLLDFWTYCCINCMHILSDLEKLENKYPDRLVIIGVHSAKFDNEQQTENISQAIRRYVIKHPVVNDYRMQVWQSYGVRAWPTLVLIDPRGRVVAHRSGEGIFEPFDQAISQLIDHYGDQISTTPIPMALELQKEASEEPLNFPGKVLVDKVSQRLFIADTANNRIVITDLVGNVLETAGSGQRGLANGSFESAQFNKPNGMALRGDTLYVADTYNHVIRALDLEGSNVETIAGTGEQGAGYDYRGLASRTALNSPWDLGLLENDLYIAMAGSHQLYRMDLDSGWIQLFAGSGREARVDGSASSAALAQPSGITTDGETIFFADSETSSVRFVTPAGRVGTLVGLDLFVFGDRDGRSDKVRLQHPIGLTYHNGTLYIADTYNNKIKTLDPHTTQVSTFAGSGKPGLGDSSNALFDEPEGLSAIDGKLYVADTGNHRIRVIDLETAEVTTLELKGFWKKVRSSATPGGAEPTVLPAITVRPGMVTLNIDIALGDEYKLTVGAPSRITLIAGSADIRFEDLGSKLKFSAEEFPKLVHASLSEGQNRILVQVDLYYCDTKNESLCFYKRIDAYLLIDTQPGAADSVDIMLPVEK